MSIEFLFLFFWEGGGLVGGWFENNEYLLMGFVGIAVMFEQ